MKKLFALAAIIVGTATASQAAVRFNLGINLPLPPLPGVVIQQRAPVYGMVQSYAPAPVYDTPAPVYSTAPVCQTSVVVAPPVCETPTVVERPVIVDEHPFYQYERSSFRSHNGRDHQTRRVSYVQDGVKYKQSVRVERDNRR